MKDHRFCYCKSLNACDIFLFTCNYFDHKSVTNLSFFQIWNLGVMFVSHVPFVLLGRGEVSDLTGFVCPNWFVGYPDNTGCKAYTTGFPSLVDGTSSDAAEGTANGMDPPDVEFPICEPATGIDGQSSFSFYFLKKKKEFEHDLNS